jgi:hypothetical protein
LCDFKGIIPTNGNNQFELVGQEITFVLKFDLHTKSVYVFVYLGSLQIVSSFLLQIDTESVHHYKGNFAFEVQRVVNPKQDVQFNSVFHTEGGSSYEDLESILTFQKLFPEMYCPIQKETFCELSETCINDSVPCKDKSGKTIVLKNIHGQNVRGKNVHGHSVINFDEIAVNDVQKITIVLNGRNGLLYPAVAHRGSFMDVLNISSEFVKEGMLESHHVVGVLNNGPKIWFNATVKCTVFSIIILFPSHPNEWCFSGNQPQIYIAKDKQIILLGHLISNPKIWKSINVSGIKDIIRVKLEMRKDNSMYEDYPDQCDKKDFISFANIGIVILVIIFAMTVTGVLSNYFHRYSIVRHNNFVAHDHGGDYPGPEIENDIEINILHRKPSFHHHGYPTKYSPIEFDHRNSKLPIEKEDILDETCNEEFEGVKVVNNIVYLED